MKYVISQQQLYHIINRAVSKCGNVENQPINTEMIIYYNRYRERQKTNLQLHIFDNPLPLQNEIKQAVQFLNDLEDYRLTIDVYAKNSDVLEETQYRRLLKGMCWFEEYISAENKKMYNILEKNIKRYLPEFKNEILLEEYIEQAETIYNMKQDYKRSRRKNKQTLKNYEINTFYFFKDILNNNELKEIEACPKKVKLYEACIKIVDCLPANKFNRMAKFKLKKELNYGLKKNAIALGDEYINIAQKAEYEERRFQNAIEKTKSYLEKSSDKNSISVASYNKRMMEEWLYR